MSSAVSPEDLYDGLTPAYVLGEVFGVSSTDGAWICETTEAAYRNGCPGRGPQCGRSSGSTAGSSPPPRPAAPAASACPSPSGSAGSTSRSPSTRLPPTSTKAVAELEELYNAAGLLRSVPYAVAPDEVAVGIRTLLDSGRYRLVGPPP